MSAFQIGHIGLNVPDIERALPFYTGVFEWDVLQEGSEPERRFAFLGDADGVVVTLWQQSDDGFATDRAGLHHLAFKVASVDDVEAAEARVRALGGTVRHDGIVPHGEGAGSGGIFFTDPDGIRLEIYTRAGADAHATAPVAGAPTCGFF